MMKPPRETWFAGFVAIGHTLFPQEKKAEFYFIAFASKATLTWAFCSL